jgi:hypothetical protein
MGLVVMMRMMGVVRVMKGMGHDFPQDKTGNDNGVILVERKVMGQVAAIG